MFEIVKYTPGHFQEWNEFVKRSKNGTFLFDRNYMDYHSDRFLDHSLMYYRKGKLYALLPAHKKGSTLCSHGGLTYGGLVMGKEATAAEVAALFEQTNAYLKSNGFSKVLYKPVPWVYHQLPSDEDLYAIFWKCKARITKRDIGTVCLLDSKERWRRNHRRNLDKAIRAGVRVEQNNEFGKFWRLLDDNLHSKFGTHPVHTLEEIELLHSRFPDNIIQYNAYIGDEIAAGYTIYITPQAIHGQYSSANSLGKENGALFAIYDRILHKDFRRWRYYDFGRSTEQDGSILNEGLISQKEGFGGRGICYDTYEWDL